MTRFLSAVLSAAFIGVMLCIPASAQNPCEEIGPDSRLLTAAEAKAFKERILAVKAIVPVPDTARYAHDGAAEASTMPFVAESKIPGAKLCGRSWPTGSFPEHPYNTLLFGYDAKKNAGKTSAQAKDPLAATKDMMAVFENRIQVSVLLRPHAYLVDVLGGKVVEVRDQDAVNIVKEPAFLSWVSNEGTSLTMVFGPRTSKEAETINTETPSSIFAPVKSIELQITGPKADVDSLKKKIDRKSFEALLGSVVK
jgi:hypothetical protein